MAGPMSPTLHLQSPRGRPPQAKRLSVAGGPRAPEQVRHWLQSAVGSLPGEVESNLTLLTCELVNNSVLHGEVGEQDVIQIELRRTARGVRAEVSDAGPGFAPQERERPIDEPGGWGLVLVERLAERWGVEQDGRTRVWFELGAA
jgi:anti-sigma regulatory factor (Ser/Thr protein kinase)